MAILLTCKTKWMMDKFNLFLCVSRYFWRNKKTKILIFFGQVSEGYKFVYIAWCGEGVSGMMRGNFANHATDFENFLTVRARPKKFERKSFLFLQKSQLGFHVRINARSENDLAVRDCCLESVLQFIFFLVGRLDYWKNQQCQRSQLYQSWNSCARNRVWTAFFRKTTIHFDS